MEAFILNAQMENLDVLDVFDSVIWADRYQGYGDFEIYTSINPRLLREIRKGFYFTTSWSDRMMIIEEILLQTNLEEGNMLTISGRSLESILDRRIVWGLITLRGNLQNEIERLIRESFTASSIADRRMTNFIFRGSADPTITGLTINAQYTGRNIYDVIVDICKTYGLGFRALPEDDENFIFELYRGIDRSAHQTVRPEVIFSPEYDNLRETTFLESSKQLKNVALIGGEGEGVDRRFTSVGNASGLNRREVFVDARDIQSRREDGSSIPNNEYIAMLQQRGLRVLSESSITKSFDGKVDATHQFIYGEDFNLGDDVQVINEFDMEAAATVSEVMHSHDRNGEQTIPVFTFAE